MVATDIGIADADHVFARLSLEKFLGVGTAILFYLLKILLFGLLFVKNTILLAAQIDTAETMRAVAQVARIRDVHALDDIAGIHDPIAFVKPDAVIAQLALHAMIHIIAAPAFFQIRG